MEGQEVLIELVRMKLPYGKYKGIVLCEIPEPYLVWLHRKGFLKGKLGMILNTLYEIKLNCLENILDELKKHYR